MLKKMKKNKKGFTLIEVIVVLVIMGILLAIAVPSVMGYVNKARDAKYIAQARNGYLAVQTIVASENGTQADPKTNFTTTTTATAAIVAELPELDGVVTAANCAIGGTGNNLTVTNCSIRVDGMDATDVVFFTPDEEAVLRPGEIK